MGETQAICGSCGLAQEAKTTFDFSSPFMTHIEHQMAERLYSIATALGDKCNYNIVLPGMDYIMGTYKNCVDNTEFCKKHKFDSKKNKNLCKKQENNIKLPYNIKYC